MAKSELTSPVVIVTLVGLVMTLIMKNVKPVPKVREDGKKVIRYGIGYEVLTWALALLSGVCTAAGVLDHQGRLAAMLGVMLAAVVLSAVYLRRYAIVYDDNEIEYYPGLGASFSCTWGDLSEITYSSQMQGWYLKLHTGHKILVYSMLHGGKDLLETAHAQTGIAIPAAAPTPWS